MVLLKEFFFFFFQERWDNVRLGKTIEKVSTPENYFKLIKIDWKK